MQRVTAGLRVRRLARGAREQAIGQVLARWRASREGKGAFCRREGIASVTLTRWPREFGGRGSKKSRAAFVEVRAAPASRASGFEVELPGDVTLRVPPGFDGADLSRLLQALRPTC